jgi:hypothetical protein
MSNECWFHHCIDFDDISHSEITPSEEMTRKHASRDDEVAAEMEILPNLWLEKRVGFYPLFMAYGATDEDRRMTGYDSNWRRVLRSWYDRKSGKHMNELVKKGDAPNKVLFSFKSVPECVMMDYLDWFMVINSYPGYELQPRLERMIFKRSWSLSDWRRKAVRQPNTVMAVVPRLDLRAADSIWCRNVAVKRQLEKMGFGNVSTMRLTLNESRI